MSPNKNYQLHDGQKGSALAIRVTPRASKSEIAEVLSDGTVKVRLAATAAGEDSNQALLDFLAGILGVPATKLEIVAGISGRDKLVSVYDLDANTVHRKILENLA
jgi:uncharacterized protein